MYQDMVDWARGSLARLLPAGLSDFLKPMTSQEARIDQLLDNYVDKLPCAQNAIDAIPGWNSGFPPHAGVTAGDKPLFADGRLEWALDRFGSIEGKQILELGPLEGSHTYMLDRLNPALIHAVEANKLAFLKCLITKEILDLKHAKFLLGDFVEWLEKTSVRYDFIVASGVLYHLRDPVRFLELLAKRSNAIYIWTHYFSDEALAPGDPRRIPFAKDVVIRRSHGIDVRLFQRNYLSAWQSPSFCGGMTDRHYWIEREDILTLLGALGFDQIAVAHESRDAANGPSFSIFARRT